MRVQQICARLTLVFAVVILSSVHSADAARNQQPVPGKPTVAQRHQDLANTKCSRFERRAGMTAMPPTVVDVSSYDVTYYRIELRIDEAAEIIYGNVTMRATALVNEYSSPTLNLQYELGVDSAFASGAPIDWLHVNSLIYLTLNTPCPLGEEFEITVFYHGRPTSGDLQGITFGEHDGTPMISNWSQPFMAQSWWPCKDLPSDKADSVDMVVTVDSALYVVSNGLLRDSVDNGDGTTTYAWHEGYPITTYLVSLAITNYARERLWYHYGPGDADSMPVWFYAYPELLTEVQTSWPIMVDQLEYFAEIFGEYPFVLEKYGMAHFSIGSAMEHQTVTSTGAVIGLDPYLIAHELAHQWWGDMVTCHDWHHIWLNEGFATYSEALWAEHVGGPSAYRAVMDEMRSASVVGGTIYVEDIADPSAIFNGLTYDKSAWVLHMLRGIVGDSAFFSILREYGSHPDNQYRNATTEDFCNIAESVSGLDLTGFFNAWIYGERYPIYAYSWISEPRTEDNFYNVHVHVRQYQTSDPLVFDMLLDLQLLGLGGNPVCDVWNTKREQDFVLVVAHPPTGITFDPNGWILGYSSEESYGLNLITEELTGGTQHLPYTDTLAARGGVPPYEYTIAAGDLPAGLTLSAATGVLTGTPLQPDTATITFGVL